MSQSQATDATRQALAKATESLPLSDTQDFDDAPQGFAARSAVRQEPARDGRVVWDPDVHPFLDGPVYPSFAIVTP